MLFFTSDWHIGHDKDFIYAARGFSSIQEHDTAILNNCNEIVKPEDELWILGDLALGGDDEEWDRIYTKINCRNVHFLQGNHDTDRRMNMYEGAYGFIYEGIAALYRISRKKTIYISHYPTITDNTDDRIIWNVSGHTHSKELFYDNHLIYNVALDAHNNYPVSIKQIYKDIEQRRLINNE